MSTALAFGAVSAVLRNVLDNGLVDAALATGAPVKVSAVAPDSIKLDDPVAPPQLNLFLYRVTPNPGWRNMGLPARDAGGQRLGNPPLAVDLHYLVTAYGKADLQAEILLGYAMHLLHERPFLDRAAIRKALSLTPLDPAVLPDAFREPPAAGLADQLEALRVTWEPMDTEEMSRIWSAMQAHYRPSVGYQVSVVLIEATRPATAPLPVLSRGEVDLATGRDAGVLVTPSLVPPFPAVEAVEAPGGKEAVELGDTLTLRGHHLDGTGVRVRFAHRLLATPHEVLVGTVTDPNRVDVALPTPSGGAATWPAGVWSVTVSLVRPTETLPRQANTVAMLLGPTPDLSTATLVRDGTTGAVTVTFDVVPHVRPEQPAVLALNTAEATAPPRTATVDDLTFAFGALPAGEAWVRLRVDGVQSPLLDRSKTPPVFLAGRSVTVPP
ncbi:MAG TPA: DUF4255 domain-containing protein [Micromonosporaceae bacterium]|nr:DUF4255 domain-containing protein [Micromonosporaceae bacterium]